MERKFFPVYKGAIEGFVKNYSVKNLWRVESSVHSLDDIFQDSYILFLELKKKYGKDVNNPKWFMSLYKVSFINYFNKLSNRRTDFYDLKNLDIFNNKDFSSDDSYFSVLLSEAPHEIKAVLNLFINSPKDLLDDIFRSWKVRGKRKDDGNAFLCELLGLNKEDVDIKKSFKDYFLKDEVI